MSKKPKTITEPTQVHYLKVFKKMQEVADGVEKPRYFAYICNSDWSDTTRTITDKVTGETMNIARSITIHLTKEFEEKITDENLEFPAKVTLLEEHYFIDYDKYKDGKFKLRNDGTKILVLVMTGYNSWEHFVPPKITLDNFDTDL